MKPLSRKRRRKRQRQALGPEWRALMEYGRFVISMAKNCRCQPALYNPCDGVLAGGPCDERSDEPDDDIDQ